MGGLSGAVRTSRARSVNRQDGRGVCTGKSVRAGFSRNDRGQAGAGGEAAAIVTAF